MKTRIWTDGACLGNPGPGGWAYRIIMSIQGEERQIDGSNKEPYLKTTNNRMELCALLNAIKRSLELGASLSSIELFSDSEWAIKCITRVYDCCKETTTTHCNILKQIWEIDPTNMVSYHHIKGHMGDANNEAVDRLAKKACRAKSWTPSREIERTRKTRKT